MRKCILWDLALCPAYSKHSINVKCYYLYYCCDYYYPSTLDFCKQWNLCTPKSPTKELSEVDVGFYLNPGLLGLPYVLKKF